MINKIKTFMGRPALYAPSTNAFWDDDYISKRLLQAHLDSGSDAGSRTPEFMDQSAAWIASIAPPGEFPRLLDMGCGPGLYAQRFLKAGYEVTGIDLSRRSIAYAKENGAGIEYHCKSFLDIDYDEAFDVITLIYYCFTELPTEARAVLLDKVYKALRPGGKFVFDVITTGQTEGKSEAKAWEYSAGGGLWSEKPYLCLKSFYRYDKDRTMLDQIIVVNEDCENCYNMWYHCFTEDSLLEAGLAAGFVTRVLYDDISGVAYTGGNGAICAVFTK